MRISALLILLIFGVQAFANTHSIPNHFRNRRLPNQGSSVGWSDRKEVNLAYQISESEQSRSGRKTAEDESTDVGAFLFYRTPVNLNVEAAVALSDSEETPVGSAKDTSESQLGLLNLGYEFTEVPLAIAALYSNIEIDSKDGTTAATSTIEGHGLGLASGYRIGSNTYLGASLKQWDFDSSFLTDDKTHYYHLGGGQVFGGEADPDGGYEAVLTFWNEDHSQSYDFSLLGFYNLGDMQYYGRVNYEARGGDADGYSYGATLGADFQISSFFVGPEFSYDYYRLESGTIRLADTDVDAALLAGLRTSSFELALEYAIETNEEDNSPSISNDESEGNTWTVSASAFF